MTETNTFVGNRFEDFFFLEMDKSNKDKFCVHEYIGRRKGVGEYNVTLGRISNGKILKELSTEGVSRDTLVSDLNDLHYWSLG